MDLRDRVALVTGTKRVGAGVAVALAAAGADVGLCYLRSRPAADAAADRIRALGRRVTVFQADLTRGADCAALVAHVASQLGRLDILVNMASIYVAKPFDELTEMDWDMNLGVDLKSAFLCSRAAVPHMRAGGGGRIINFSDWLPRSGRPRYPGYLTYYVAKAGVIGLTEALALELAADGILVNAVAPGPILAPPETTDEEFKAVERATPLGKWGGEDEIAKTVLALIDSNFITGETVRVDGGRHVK